MKNTLIDHQEEEEFLGLLLEGVKGSLAEERRSRQPRNFNLNLKKIRSLNQKFKVTVQETILKPSLLEKKLAEIAADNPTFPLEFKIRGWNRILGKDQYRKIKNMLLTLEFKEIPNWLKFLIQEPLLKLVPRRAEPGIQAELVFLVKILSLPETQKFQVLEKLYSQNNLKQQIEAGTKLFCSLSWQIFSDQRVKTPERKRGYTDKGSTSLKSERERKKCLMEQNQELEILRKKILKKQMLLFERNLDQLLQLDESTTRRERLELIKNQNDQLEQINSTTSIFERNEDENEE